MGNGGSRFIVRFALTLLFCCATDSTAGTNRWTNATVGMVLDSLVVSPGDSNHLYGTNWETDGVYESTDGGLNWKWISWLDDDSSETRIVIDPSNPRIMYATVGWGISERDNSTIQKSMNGGLTWHEVYDFEGFWPGNVAALALDPMNTRVIYVATDAGVFKSENGGETWATLLDHGPFWDLIVDPAATRTLYAVSYYVLKSTDGGQNWSRADSGLPDTVHCLLVDPANHLTVYAATGEGVFVTRDGGLRWTRSSNGIGSVNVRRIVLVVASPLRLMAATAEGELFRSDGDGANWTPCSIPGSLLDWEPDCCWDFEAITALAADPSSSGTVYACVFSRGLMKTTDSGGDWILSGRDRSTDHRAAGWSTWQVCVGGLEQGYIYLVGDRLLRRSDDSGRTWRVISDGLPPGAGDLLVDPERPRLVYARGKTIYRSGDAGRSWEQATRGIRGTGAPTTYAMDPTNPAHLIACFAGGGVFETTDGAIRWTHVGQVPADKPRDLLADPKDASVLYVIDPRSKAIFRSENGGAGWKRWCSLPGTSYDDLRQAKLDPHDPSSFYALTYRGLYRRKVDAVHWERLGLRFGALNAGCMAFDPDTAGVLYVGAGVSWDDTSTVFRSTDGGRTWSDMRSVWPGLPRAVDDLAVTPGDPPRLFAATERGLYVLSASK